MEQQKDNIQKTVTESDGRTQGQGFSQMGQRISQQTNPPSGNSGQLRQIIPSQNKQPAQSLVSLPAHASSGVAGQSNPSAVRSSAGVHSKSSPNPHGFDYVMRKAEKLTTALYLVTDIMSEKEPLKWKASEKMSVLRNIMKKAEKVIAFLDVAQAAHLMSDMNSSMLKKEYIALKDNIEGEWSRVHEKSKSIFSENFFDVPKNTVQEPERLPSSTFPHRVNATAPFIQREELRQENENKSSQETASSAQNKPMLATEAAETATPVSATPMTLRKHEEVKKETPPLFGRMSVRESDVRMSAPQLPTARPSANEQSDFFRPRNDAERDDRRKIILALIKQKPALTVRDITKSIPQVSEKTIQRELFSMVAEGTLLKRGERRWSTYSLRVV